MSTDARETALRVLVSCRKGGAWADGALKTAIAKDRLTGADAALATRLVYGVVQNRALAGFPAGGVLLPEGWRSWSLCCWISCAWVPTRSCFWTGCQTAPPSMKR